MTVRSRSLGRGLLGPAREVPLMATLLAFLKFLAKAMLNAVEVLPEVARVVWRGSAKVGSPEALPTQMQALAALPPDEPESSHPPLAPIDLVEQAERLLRR